MKDYFLTITGTYEEQALYAFLKEEVRPDINAVPPHAFPESRLFLIAPQEEEIKKKNAYSTQAFAWGTAPCRKYA